MELIRFLSLLSVIATSDAAKILAYYPVPSISHQLVFRPVMQELARRGHQLTIITTDPVFPGGAKDNYTEIDIHNVSYNIWRDVLNVKTGEKGNFVNQIRAHLEAFMIILEKQLISQELQQLIRSRNKFDLIFVEACAKSALIMSHIFNAPVIQISSLGAIHGNYEVMGATKHRLLYPLSLCQKIYNLTLWEKIKGLYIDYVTESLIYTAYDKFHKDVIGKIFPDAPSLDELSDNVDMMFLNTRPMWEGNRPVPPGVMFMGGLHQKHEQPLPNDLKAYLDSSTQGVIYVSFGTNVAPSLLPPERMQILNKVFSGLPYNVLWKWDKGQLSGKAKNIRTEKWFPQSDLLRHKNIKLFITQGGLQSTDEAITAGVPLVGIPMISDQWYNVEKIVHYGIGRGLDIETLTEEGLREAIMSVIEDDSYRTNMIRMRSLMRDQSEESLTRAVWWTEHVLRHKGAKHFRSPAANMSWFHYYEVPLLGLVTAVVFSLLTIVVLFMCYLVRFVSRLRVRAAAKL